MLHFQSPLILNTIVSGTIVCIVTRLDCLCKGIAVQSRAAHQSSILVMCSGKYERRELCRRRNWRFGATTIRPTSASWSVDSRVLLFERWSRSPPLFRFQWQSFYGEWKQGWAHHIKGAIPRSRPSENGYSEIRCERDVLVRVTEQGLPWQGIPAIGFKSGNKLGAVQNENRENTMISVNGRSGFVRSRLDLSPSCRMARTRFLR